LQIVGLITPLLTQLVVDRVIPAQRLAPLTWLAFGILAVVCSQALLRYVRAAALTIQTGATVRADLSPALIGSPAVAGALCGASGASAEAVALSSRGFSAAADPVALGRSFEGGGASGVPACQSFRSASARRSSSTWR